MGIIILALPLLISSVFLVISLVRQQRYKLAFAPAINALVIAGAALAFLSVPLYFVLGGESVFTLTGLIGLLASVVGFILGFVSPRTEKPARVLAHGAYAVAAYPQYAPVVSAPGPAAPVAQPGWFPAADRPGELRWWDGSAWTDNYHRQE